MSNFMKNRLICHRVFPKKLKRVTFLKHSEHLHGVSEKKWVTYIFTTLAIVDQFSHFFSLLNLERICGGSWN